MGGWFGTELEPEQGKQGERDLCAEGISKQGEAGVLMEGLPRMSSETKQGEEGRVFLSGGLVQSQRLNRVRRVSTSLGRAAQQSIRAQEHEKGIYGGAKGSRVGC